jgi:hypothetical protein
MWIRMAEGNTVSFQVGLSDQARAEIAAMINESVERAMARVARGGRPARVGIRNNEVPGHIGMGRSKFFQLWKSDPAFLACSFVVDGVRIWSTEALDQWMRDRLKRQGPSELQMPIQSPSQATS